MYKQAHDAAATVNPTANPSRHTDHDDATLHMCGRVRANTYARKPTRSMYAAQWLRPATMVTFCKNIYRPIGQSR